MTNLSDEELSVLKTKLFGSGAAGIPPTFLELLLTKQAAEREIAVFEDYAKGEFRAYWLDGQLFRSLVYSGTGNDASAHELAYPLSTLSSVNTICKFEYDDHILRHTYWKRRMTLQFRDEPIVLEDRCEAMQDTKVSQFVDAVLRVIASG